MILGHVVGCLAARLAESLVLFCPHVDIVSGSRFRAGKRCSLGLTGRAAVGPNGHADHYGKENLPRIVLKHQEGLRVQDARHGLQLIENHPPQVGVVDGADQQDHIKIASHQRDVMDLRDGAQLFAQLRQV